MPQPGLVESVQILTDMGVDTSLDVSIGDLLAEPWTHQVELLEPDIRVNEEDLGHRPVIVLDEADLPLTLVQPQLRDVAEIFCAYCHNSIETGVPAVACRRCGAPYHEDCWNASRRCAALGCESKRSVSYQPAQRTEQGLMSTIPTVQPTEETLKEKILRFLRSLRG